MSEGLFLPQGPRLHHREQSNCNSRAHRGPARRRGPQRRSLWLSLHTLPPSIWNPAATRLLHDSAETLRRLCVRLFTGKAFNTTSLNSANRAVGTHTTFGEKKKKPLSFGSQSNSWECPSRRTRAREHRLRPPPSTGGARVPAAHSGLTTTPAGRGHFPAAERPCPAPRSRPPRSCTVISAPSSAGTRRRAAAQSTRADPARGGSCTWGRPRPPRGRRPRSRPPPSELSARRSPPAARRLPRSSRRGRRPP